MRHPLFKKFSQQRIAAGQRGIVWNITFRDWLRIWEESGQLENRGCSKGKYCMSRNGDEGPYSADNVNIIRFEQNSFDSAVKYMPKYAGLASNGAH